jgi:hypothetical protein
MTCIDCPPATEEYGVKPTNIQWNVVRGDTAKLKIEFLNNDEVTNFNTTGWTFLSTAYSQVSGSTNTLTTSMSNNVLTITATPAQTATWGTGSSSIVAQLNFDLQVTIPGAPAYVWTPIVGNISVIGDVTGGSL